MVINNDLQKELLIAREAFLLYTSKGYHWDYYLEDLEENRIIFNKTVVLQLIEELMEEHKKISRKSAYKKFKQTIDNKPKE